MMLRAALWTFVLRPLLFLVCDPYLTVGGIVLFVSLWLIGDQPWEGD